MMNGQVALITAGCVFGFVAFMHLLRLMFKVEIVAGGKRIPQWTSMLGLLVAAFLVVWMFKAALIF
jgi:hypothetical protein